ncbi:hypothetical protein YDYSY3_38780 [Paenibacillus chitinolyticus]|uniref:hypothetical protein n=1 Tax=Paenibacillus chitinolyticus TaxID=79263 RepID=UPI0026E4C9BB|nr:hypothetical protein [Paenibacillus chitinolyticus]GKS12878.1 hypothetical protein YDYSY3_38780 [Paenibacillus chitinolyticus]
MEDAYFYREQLDGMQASYDSFVMVKIIQNAGIDVYTDPIHFHTYEWGSQITVFLECLERIFGAYELSNDDLYLEEIEMKLPVPKLKEVRLLLPDEDAAKLIQDLQEYLSHCCDYFELEMEGKFEGEELHVKLSGYGGGLYSSFLKRLVEIKNKLDQVVNNHWVAPNRDRKDDEVA